VTGQESQRDFTADDFLALARQRVERLDARLLLQEVSGLSHAQLIARPNAALTETQWGRLTNLLERRAAGEPLAYLLGYTEFRGRRFAVSPAVLIPRPETEELVGLAQEIMRRWVDEGCAGRLRCADLGTGSGVIAISLKLECPAAEVVAVELSVGALAVTRANAEALGAVIDFRLGDWYAPLAGERFDLIVANPPYVAASDPHLEQNGLPHEPRVALTDGGDGLDCIRAIVAGAPAALRAGGCLLFEHGWDQGEAARNLLWQAGFESTFTATDLSRHERFSGGYYSGR